MRRMILVAVLFAGCAVGRVTQHADGSAEVEGVVLSATMGTACPEGTQPMPPVNSQRLPQDAAQPQQPACVRMAASGWSGVLGALGAIVTSLFAAGVFP